MEAGKARKIVSTLRQRLNDGRYLQPISTQQRLSQKAAPNNNNVSAAPSWVSQVTLPVPSGQDLRSRLFEVISALGEGCEKYDGGDGVEAVAVRGEWVGHDRQAAPEGGRTSVSSDGMTEGEKYECLMRDVSSEVTLLHVHGGAFYRGSPAASRSVTGKLAKLTGGRCFSVQYRLAPQTPFPGALLDLLVAYLSLLHPPPGAFHAAVRPSTIVFTGDSSGANLCLSLLQVLLELGRQQKTSAPTIHWNGRDVAVPVPGGLAAISAWADLALSLPSWTTDPDYDIMETGPPRQTYPNFPRCGVWPTDPPRGDLYCDLSWLCHPLVSPTAAADWTGAPPLLFLCGDERAADSNRVIARQALSQGCRVVWEQYEIMPHIFMFLLEKFPHSALAFERWASFCRKCVEEGGGMKSRGSFVEVETLSAKEVDLRNLTTLTVEDARAYMRAEQATRRAWTDKVWNVKPSL